ncbi:MAG: YecH family protein [Reinekea sp.]|nr:YecH family protein [Reinekea sp.]
MQTHVHDILTVLANHPGPHSRESLEQTIIGTFGEEMRFHSCANEGMTASEAVQFLIQHGKFTPQETPDDQQTNL